MPKRTKAGEDEITERSRKDEILAAYRKLQREMDESPKVPLAPKAEPAAAKKPADSTEPPTPGVIVRDLATLKVGIGQYLSDLERGLIEESGKLRVIKEASVLEEGRLEELHGIDTAAGTLAELRERQAAEKRDFEAELAEARVGLKEEREEAEAELRELHEEDKRRRGREEEEYTYETKQKRQRNEDAFQAEMERRKREFEEEIKARETEVTGREEAVENLETELARLRKEVESFPAALQKEIEAAEKRATKAAEEGLWTEKLVLEKDIEREREVHKLTVQGLQERVKEQEARINVLNADLKEAMAQSQAVASRAIDSIAATRAAGRNTESRREENE